jgi:hypothetical protein
MLRSGDRLRKRSLTCRKPGGRRLLEAGLGLGRAGQGSWATCCAAQGGSRLSSKCMASGAGTGRTRPSIISSASSQFTLKSLFVVGAGAEAGAGEAVVARPPRGMLRCLTIRTQENMTSPGRAWISSRGRGTLLIRNHSDEETVRTGEEIASKYSVRG